MTSPQLEDGFIRIANELFEAVLGFGFTHREVLVLLTIMRKTYGYGKKTDDMSASQIGDVCNIARQHVTSTLNGLALRNVISKAPGRFGSIIGIQKNHKKWVSENQICGPRGSPDLGQGSPDLGHVPIRDAGSPDLGQVDSPDSGHTKDNLPKDNYQKKRSCAPQAKRESKSGSSAKDLQDRFERFYAAYPKKKSKKAAERAFAKLRPDEQLLTAILAGIERAMTSGQWVDPQFIPYPASWLNDEGWCDEIQTEYSAVELGVIDVFNEKMGGHLGAVPAAPFVESRAAAIREFLTFSKRPQLPERFFGWLSEGVDLPPNVGFDWLISRKGFSKVSSANQGKS